MLYSCMCAQWLSHVYLFATPQTVVRQAPLSMRFPRQEYWNRLPFPTPGDLPNPRIKPVSHVSCLGRQGGRFFTTRITQKGLLLPYIFTKKFALDPHTPSASFLCSFLGEEKKKNLLQTYLQSLFPICLFLLPLALTPVKYLIPPSTEIAFSRSSMTRALERYRSILYSTVLISFQAQELGKIFFQGFCLSKQFDLKMSFKGYGPL